jgi:biopolymer transport protein ExbB
MAYNWLMRRNKSVLEELARFSNDLHGYMMSGGKVKPITTGAAAAARGGTAPVGSMGGASLNKAGSGSTGTATGATTAGVNKI